MFTRPSGEMVGTGIAAVINLSLKLIVIVACGRYLGWW